MSEGEKKELVPKLRFPEFRQDVTWNIKRLNDVFDRITLKNRGNNQNVLTISAQMGLVSQLEYFNKKVSASDVTGYYLLKKGDFAYNKSYSKGYPMGAIKPLKHYDSGVVSTLYICFRVKDGYNTIYFEQYFEQYFDAGALNSEIEKLAQEGGRAHGLLNVSVKEFFTRISVSIPKSSIEQQKIAACLTFLDDLITAHTQKLDTLKAHKKGLMQNLFPGEGESVPRVRFGEFEGEWASQKLDTVAERGSGHTPNKQIDEYYNGSIKWVSLADSKLLDRGFIYQTKISISKKGIENSSATIHPKGSVIMSRDAGVGKSAVLHEDMAVSQHFIAWNCNIDLLSNWFLYYFLQTMKPEFENIAVGNTIKTIGLPYFKKLSIFTPSIKEQQKIANCLISVDDLITTQTQKIESLKTHKKGLMQNLFPAMNEVDG